MGCSRGALHFLAQCPLRRIWVPSGYYGDMYVDPAPQPDAAAVIPSRRQF